MRDSTRHLSVLMLLLALLSLPAGLARAEGEVDLELALTVDVSLSMDLDEQRLQREGYVAAFRDPEIWAAIKSGVQGRIAVTYVEWAGIATQNTVLPWTLIDGAEAAQAFAKALEDKPISRARMTSISGALQYSARAFEHNAYRGTRRVIDVSGDGPNNSGPPVVPVRDAVVASGIIINGLPVQLKNGGPNSRFDIENLDEYYANCVIGGPGSFSLPVREKGEFAAAIRQKLVLEIADLRPARPARLQRTHSGSETGAADCLIGEKMWRRYMETEGFR